MARDPEMQRFAGPRHPRHVGGQSRIVRQSRAVGIPWQHPNLVLHFVCELRESIPTVGDLCTTALGQAWVGPGGLASFSQREKIEMRGTLATATGYRSPPPLRSVTPVTQTSSAGDICVTQPKGRTPASRPLGAGRAGRSCLFSPREKIEMRGTLATATGYRSPPPSRSVTPVTQTSSAGDICVTQPKGRTPASRPLGAGRAGRSYLFSPREKIEMRGTLATATGHRSPPPSRSVTPATQRSP